MRSPAMRPSVVGCPGETKSLRPSSRTSSTILWSRGTGVLLVKITTPATRRPDLFIVQTSDPFFNSCMGTAPKGVSISVFAARHMGHVRIYPFNWQKYGGGGSPGYPTGEPHPCTHS